MAHDAGESPEKGRLSCEAKPAQKARLLPESAAYSQHGLSFSLDS